MALKNQEWIKSITDVEKIAVDQEPYLSLKINGKGAIIHQTQKYTALMNGCLCVIGDTDKLSVKDQFYFERVMPEVKMKYRDGEGERGIKTIYRNNFTNDPRVVQIWLDVFGGKIANRKIRKSLEELGYKLPDYIY